MKLRPLLRNGLWALSRCLFLQINFLLCWFPRAAIQSGWLRTMEIYCLIDLEVRNPRIAEVSVRYLKCVGEESFLDSSSL